MLKDVASLSTKSRCCIRESRMPLNRPWKSFHRERKRMCQAANFSNRDQRSNGLLTFAPKELVRSSMKLEDITVHTYKNALEFGVLFKSFPVSVEPRKSRTNFGIGTKERLKYIAILACQLHTVISVIGDFTSFSSWGYELSTDLQHELRRSLGCC
jgi:hypothetical protein